MRRRTVFATALVVAFTLGPVARADDTVSQEMFGPNGFPSVLKTSTGACVTVAQPGSPDGSRVEAVACRHAPSQMFRLTDKGELVDGDGKCITVKQEAAGQAARVEADTCNGAKNQQWEVDGLQLKNGLGDCLMPIETGATNPPVTVTAQKCGSSNLQNWTFDWPFEDIEAAQKAQAAPCAKMPKLVAPNDRALMAAIINEVNKDVKDVPPAVNPPAPPATLAQQVADLKKAGRYQEAIWLLEFSGEHEQAIKLRDELIKILTTNETDQKDLKWTPLDKGGVTQGKWLVEFPGGIKAVYKRECPTCDSGGPTSSNKEIAASKMDQLLQLNIVPITIPFSNNSTHGSLQMFIQDAKTGNEDHEDPGQRIHDFDHLLKNTDRHGGNYLDVQLGKDGPKVQAAIDHNRTFYQGWPGYTSANEHKDNMDIAYDQYFFDHLRRLSVDKLKSELGSLYSPDDFADLLRRRDAILTASCTAYQIPKEQCDLSTQPPKANGKAPHQDLLAAMKAEVDKGVAKPPKFVMQPLEKYKTLTMDQALVKADKDAGIGYMDADELKTYRIHFGSDGKLYTEDGHLLDTSAGINGSGAHNKNAPCGRFVMDENGNFYIEVGHPDSEFKHSSFFAGGPVAAAGEISVLNGVPVYLNRESGHYKPTPESLKNAEDLLEQMTHTNLQIDP